MSKLIARFFSATAALLAALVTVFGGAVYVTAAFARCTARCEGMDGAQFVHNLAGLGEYLGGAIALGVAGAAFARSGRSTASAVAWLLCVFGYLLFLGWREPAEEQRSLA